MGARPGARVREQRASSGGDTGSRQRQERVEKEVREMTCLSGLCLSLNSYAKEMFYGYWKVGARKGRKRRAGHVMRLCAVGLDACVGSVFKLFIPAYFSAQPPIKLWLTYPTFLGS